MFAAIARFSVRFRWFIIIFWIAMVPVATAVFPSINSVTKDNNSQFLPKSSPTSKASDLENQFQSKNTAGTSVIVAVRDDGPLTAADNTAINQISTKVKGVKDVTTVKNQGQFG